MGKADDKQEQMGNVRRWKSYTGIKKKCQRSKPVSQKRRMPSKVSGLDTAKKMSFELEDMTTEVPKLKSKEKKD